MWEAFIGQPDRLRTLAAAIEQSLPELDALPHEVIAENEEAEEGGALTRLHRFRERDRGIVGRSKDKILKETGTLACEACGFDFRERYGSRGDGFLECHHALPESTFKPGERTKAVDLVVLCANCHRMLNVARPWLIFIYFGGLLRANIVQEPMQTVCIHQSMSFWPPIMHMGAPVFSP